jgi:hypothetical protein
MTTLPAVIESLAVMLSEAAGQPAYQRAINGAVRGLWNGAYTPEYFADVMRLAIRKYLTEAWTEGAASVGIAKDEITNEEGAALQSFISSEIGFIAGFRDAIKAGSKANGGGLAPLQSRAALWANRYQEVFNRALMMAKGNTKLEWVLGPTEEHCSDCGRLAGKVKRVGTWWSYPLSPQSHDLACKGFNCKCRLKPTRKPITPGPLPRPSTRL